MINKGKTTTTTEDLIIRGLLDNYLRIRSSAVNASFNDDSKHLDDDSLSAFVEGNLSQRESTPILSHLVDCSFCRHVTAELVRLDFAFAGEETPARVAPRESAPTSVSDVLNNLLSRIFGTSDSAVLAHQQPEEKEDDEKAAEETEEDKKES
ncbi:MAG TPA: hypothetical protein VK400_16280 [Pyrinomonadaceae bacterium]|nr:hypothetical protein [Pyrinomonadaceae bacterium]